MKKRTKKKIKKHAKNSFLFLLKLIFVYPVKGIVFLIKKLSKKTKSKIQEVKQKKVKKEQQKNKPQVQAKFDKFKEIEKKKGSLESFEKKLYSNSSTIGIILGARGTGKSAIGMRLLENFKAKNQKRIYALGFKEESLPDWIQAVEDIEQIENNSIILIDEGGITFSSRRAMSNPNKILSELLLIARHKDLSVIFITQNSSNLEINAIRQADYLFLKPNSLLQMDFERKKIKDVYQSVQDDFEKLKDKKGLTYIYTDSYRGFVTNSLPSFWSDKVSKGFSGK